MISIRKGTFETNSSSTHSICVTKEDTFCKIPERLEVNLKDYEFGWETEKYRSTDEKFAYLIMGIVAGWQDTLIDVTNMLNELMSMLTNIGVKSITIQGLDIVCYEGKKYYDAYDGYVDHASEMEEMVETLLHNEEMLKRYLFSADSFILTGNDNNDCNISINVDYDYDEFYKGN